MTRMFSVKNFSQLQHYSDRSPPWIKLYNYLLEDYEFAKLPDASKFHLVAIWLLASRTKNKIPYDSQWVQMKIAASEVVNLDALAQAGFIVVDQEEKHDARSVLANGKQDDALEQSRGEQSRAEQKRASAPGSDYYFAGKTIRITAEQADRWKKSYQHVGADLVALLQSRDDWYQTLPEAQRKRWFPATSAYLAKLNRERAGREESGFDPARPRNLNQIAG